jgi:hypothetical protein
VILGHAQAHGCGEIELFVVRKKNHEGVPTFNLVSIIISNLPILVVVIDATVK